MNKKGQRAKTTDLATDINSKLSSWDSRFEAYSGKVKRDEIEFSFSDAFDYISAGKIAKKKAVTLADIHPEFVKYKEKTTQGDNAAIT